MSNKELHIFKENTDAIATNRGFYYQHLKTMKLWINNYIANNDMDIYCEWEDDITEHNQHTKKYKFHQVKSYSDKLGINDEHFTSSILNFYNLYTQYDVDEFYFVTNSDFKPHAGKELKEWYDNLLIDNYDIPNDIIKNIKANLIAYVTKRLKKSLDSIKEKTLKEQKENEIENTLSDMKNDLERDDFINFLRKIRFDITKISDPKEDIENLELEIVDLLKSDKLQYDRTTNQEHLFRSIYYEVAKKSSNDGKINRLLNRDVLARILNFVQTNAIFDLYIDNQSIKNSINETHQIYGLYPSNIEQIKEAERLAKNEDYTSAIAKYQELENLKHSDELQYKIANLYYLNGDYSSVIDLCNNTGSTKFIVLRAISFGKVNKYTEALNELLKVSDDDQDYKVHYNIGVSYMFLSDLENAIKYFMLSIEKNDKFESAYLNLAICQYRNNPLSADKEVIDNLDKALKIDKTLEGALSQKGEVLRFLGKYAKAKKTFKEVLAINPSNTTALYGLAMCLFENKKYQDGLIHFNNWFHSVYTKDIQNEIVIVDIGYKKTISLVIKTVNNNLELHIDNHQFIIQSNIGNDFMYIGIQEIENIKYPILGKKYLKFEDYINTKTQIINVLNLQQDIIETNNKDVNTLLTHILEMIDFDKKLKIFIDENKGFVKIEIGEITISGFIEVGDGFSDFIDEYHNTQLCSIFLENSENNQKFIIYTYQRCEIID